MPHPRRPGAIALCLAMTVATSARADDPRPLRVLLVTGGCCHDYAKQKEIIAKGLADRARVEVTAVQQGGTTTTAKIPLYEDPDWSKGYDVVIHDECFSDAKDTAWTARILKPHREGLPAVVVHCAMHCYRDGTDEWFKFCGVTSHGHGAAYPHEVLNVDAAHPIMTGFGPAWANPAGELYWISKLWPTAHPLATSKNKEKGNDEVCVWTNQFDKARVFGTTLGHHNETVSSPAFLDLLTRGTLWAADKLDDRYLKPKVAGAPPAVAEAAKLAGVKVPDGFEMTLFASPPAVSYPVFVAAAPNGDVYVSSDKNGSLDRGPRRGSVLRLRDLDGDGRADESKRFVPDVDSPRGLVFDRDRVYLMHPPHLSAFIDKDGDGVADEQKILVKDIAFGFKDRPADHTSNGVTLGIDGWLYLAIGDFGFLNAQGADGRTLQLRGGGVVRVRPDGSGLELYSRGTRNILEVGVDPLLNGFARDNTNDGGGWDIRLHHFSGLEEHGYPSLYKNFTDEAVAPLADYGGGSGCGGLYLSEPGFPPGFGDALYTADWGRDRVFRHRLTPKGATFAANQDEFMNLTRVTDLDVDASGHMFVSSWKGATFTYAGEEVGFLVRVSPKGVKADPLPDYARLDPVDLVEGLKSPSHRRRLAAQRELLAKGVDERSSRLLLELARDRARPLPVRVAALFTLKGGLGARFAPTLAGLVSDPDLREYALRALTDRADGLAGVPVGAIVEAVRDGNPRVRRQAAESLARLGSRAAPSAKALRPLLADPDPVVVHTAIRALISLKAADACLAILDDPQDRTAARVGALRALQAIHEPEVADGLIARMEKATDPVRRLALFAALCRLDHRDGPWKGDSWGTRPDTSGPYYQPEAWDATPRIESALGSALAKAGSDEVAGMLREADRNKVDLKADAALVARADRDPALIPAVVAHLARGRSTILTAVPLLARVASGTGEAGVRADATVALIRADADEALAPALASLIRLDAEGRDRPGFVSAKEAFLTAPRSPAGRGRLEGIATRLDGPASVWAEAALLSAGQERRGGGGGAGRSRPTEPLPADPKRRAQRLRAVALAEHRPSAPAVAAALADPDPAVASAAREAARVLKLDADGGSPRPTGPKVGTLAVDAAISAVGEAGRRARLGEAVFNRLACLNCHAVRPTDPPRGPYLGTIATTYKRRDLAESILAPSKTIAQGFATNVFELDDGRSVTGFVVKESAEGVVLRDAEGKEIALSPQQVVDRAKSPVSVMPEGLVKDLTVGEFAALLDYLESLPKAQPAQ